MAFPLLLVCIALLFNRPGDWVPALAGLPLFQSAIIACLSLSIGQFLSRLQATSAVRTPVSVCVNGLLAVVILSALVNGSPLEVVTNFAKSWVLYFLVLALVDSPRRLRIALIGTAVSILGIALLIVLDHHTGMFGGISSIETEEGLRTEAIGGAMFDSNDTAALLVVAVLIFVATTIDSRSKILRCLCIVFAIISLDAIQLCNSRSSLLALLAGIGVYIYLRWGSKGLKWGAILLPIVVVFVATDRMTDISALQRGTGQSRMQFWSIGLSLLVRNPILGIGPDEFVSIVGKACHNSFVQAFAELGVFGGAMFVGAFYLSITCSMQLARTVSSSDGEKSAAYPTVLIIPSVLVAYSTSLMTLNHLYGCHTYLLLATSAVASSVYGFSESEESRNVGSNLIGRLGKVACIFLAVTYVGCLVFVQW